ncbi:MAG TPA: MFS transporter [Vicinamibacteria bacterium]|nr:MFS transporter [Vicinamibacteria bacterium]
MLRSSLIALTHRNFRLLWFGTLVSMSGSFMRTAAILWHVSLLAPPGKKALALGMVGLVRVLPIFVFSFVSGIVADASDRRKLMLLTNVSMMALSGALALVTFAGRDSLTVVYVLAAAGAAMASFDNPARQSLFPSLVPRDHLQNAISLNATMMQASSVLGPLAGGAIIALGGVAWVYTVDAASFLILELMLILMKDVPERPASERGELSFRAGVEGFRWVFRQPLIRSTMLLDFVATFFASAEALLPIFAQDILRVGPGGYGLLAGAPAMGAMVTSVLMVPLLSRIERRGRLLMSAVMAYAIATVVFGVSTFFWLTFFCLLVVGASDMVSTVLRNIIRHMHTPDSMRGRMTSVNMVFFMGGPQLGELEAGLVAQALGPAVSVVSGGVACLVAVIVIAWKTPTLVAYGRE